MNARELPLEQIRAKGLEALSRELGTVGLIRFLQMFETGSGDYTKEREHLLQQKSLDEIVAEIERGRNPR